jgi:hypothetical protein
MIMQARTGDTVLVKSREMTGSSQTLPWWLGGETTENKIHWSRWARAKGQPQVTGPRVKYTYTNYIKTLGLFLYILFTENTFSRRNNWLTKYILYLLLVIWEEKGNNICGYT